MLSSLLTIFTEIKVFADAALISCSDNRSFSTSITFNSLMDSLRRWINKRRRIDFLSNFWAVHKIVENLLALLVKFLFGESLESFSRKATHVLLTAFVSFFIALTRLLVFVFSLGVVRIWGHIHIIVTCSGYLIRLECIMNCSLNKRSTNFLFNLCVFFEFLLLNFFNLVTLRFLVWFWVNLNERAWCILQIWSWIDLEL